MQNILIVGNWKMNPESQEGAEALFVSLLNGLNKVDTRFSEVVICPPFVYLDKFSKMISRKKVEKNKIRLGAQNCFWEESGAFTGEISPKMLKSFGCGYVILGHSERREYLRETDEDIFKKMKASLKLGLKTILCIGEKEEEREEEMTFEVLKNQLHKTIGELSRSDKITNIIIAYEPVWAIGTGKDCPVNEAMSVLTFIKKELLKIFPLKTGERIKILYGGSVNSKNCKGYIENGFNGLLVGGASLKPSEFLGIIKNCEEKNLL